MKQKFTNFYDAMYNASKGNAKLKMNICRMRPSGYKSVALEKIIALVLRYLILRNNVGLQKILTLFLKYFFSEIVLDLKIH